MGTDSPDGNVAPPHLWPPDIAAQRVPRVRSVMDAQLHPGYGTDAQSIR
jgi:hypothetical protein